MKLVDQWWKAWSVWGLSAITFLAGAQIFLPDLQQALPPHWYPIVSGAILIARIIKQGEKDAAP